MSNRLKELRVFFKVSLQMIAEHLECDIIEYLNYENDLGELPSLYLVKITKYYNVSSDFILGNISLPISVDFINEEIDIITNLNLDKSVKSCTVALWCNLLIVKHCKLSNVCFIKKQNV